MFVVFEGIDGAGKGYNSQLVAKYLKKLGKTVKSIRYPDREGPYRDLIYGFLDEKLAMSPTSQFLTFLADMAKDQDAIAKYLSSGGWIVSDRYVFSAIAYQKIPIEKGREIVKSLGFVRPDMIFHLSISPETAVSRIEKKRKYRRFEKDREHLMLANIRYRSLAEDNFMGRWIKIDASKEPEKVEEEIKGYLSKK